jgi:hypothetical protein
MKTGIRRVRSGVAGLAAAALTVVVVATAPGVAAAAGSLPTDGSAILEFTDSGSYAVTGGCGYWSVGATVGSQGFNPDVEMRDQAGRSLASSRLGRVGGLNTIDWVALDFNRLPYDRPYEQLVTENPVDAGSPAKYLAQFVAGCQTLTPGAPREIGYPQATNWLVDVRDLYLTAGQTVRLDVGAEIRAAHVVRSDPRDPSTFARGRTAADKSLDMPAATGGSMVYTAPAAGWYGVVFEADAWHGRSTVTATILP